MLRLPAQIYLGSHNTDSDGPPCCDRNVSRPFWNAFSFLREKGTPSSSYSDVPKGVVEDFFASVSVGLFSKLVRQHLEASNVSRKRGLSSNPAFPTHLGIGAIDPPFSHSINRFVRW